MIPILIILGEKTTCIFLLPLFVLQLSAPLFHFYTCDIVFKTIRKNKIQNYDPRILRNTIQPEFRNLSTSIIQPIWYIQIQTGSLVLLFLQVFLSLMFNYIAIIQGRRVENQQGCNKIQNFDGYRLKSCILLLSTTLLKCL